MKIETIWKTYEAYEPEVGIDEFVCPARIEEPRNNLQTTEACENKSMNAGCKHLEKCPTYQRTKKLEQEHGDLNKLPPEKHSEIKMIIKGIIIPK